MELVDTLFAFFANTVSFVRVAAFAAVHAGVFIAMFALSRHAVAAALRQPLSIVTLIAGNVVMMLLEGLDRVGPGAAPRVLRILRQVLQRRRRDLPSAHASQRRP